MAADPLYQRTEPLTDTLPAHVEAARARAHAACVLQAYQQLQAAGRYTVTVGEILMPVVGGRKGSITRTLQITS